jgi:lysophospholipase L1-like esterase
MKDGEPETAGERHRPPSAVRGRRIAAYSATGILALIVAELLVRGWAYHLREEFEQYDYATGVYRLVPGSYSSGAQSVITINSDGFRGPELAPQAPNLLWIFAVGDSCTFGAGNEKYTYPAILQELLSARKPVLIHHEVVNAAIAGADSEDALRRLISKVLPLQPDVVTIYIGWNDLMKYSPLAQTDAGLSSRMRRSVDRLWLVRAIRKAIFFYFRPVLVSPEVGPESRTGRFRNFSPGAFEKNLSRMTAATREAGARPVLVTLPTPLRVGMSEKRIRDRQIAFPYFGGAARVGDFLDLIDAYNRAIRRVAIENAAPVVDLARAVGVLEDPTGYFWDAMHMNREGQLLIARSFEQTLDQAGMLTPAAPKAHE